MRDALGHAAHWSLLLGVAVCSGCGPVNYWANAYTSSLQEAFPFMKSTQSRYVYPPGYDPHPPIIKPSQSSQPVTLPDGAEGLAAINKRAKDKDTSSSIPPAGAKPDDESSNDLGADASKSSQ